MDQLFADAFAVPREEQAAFLARNCPDPGVRREVESLLTFASRPLHGIAEAIGDAAAALASPDLIGHRVGAYRLIDRIGQGGMGAVYRATRDDGEFQPAGTPALPMYTITFAKWVTPPVDIPK